MAFSLSTQAEAGANATYLDSQLVTIADPLVREKVQGLLANEIEKAMLVSKEAFRVADPPYLQRQFKELKLFPIVFGAGLFFLACVLVFLMHAFSTSEKSEEDRRLMEGIKQELRIFK
jgi:hypothetical protein